jgi:hypothetical protein
VTSGCEETVSCGSSGMAAISVSAISAITMSMSSGSLDTGCFSDVSALLSFEGYLMM